MYGCKLWWMCIRKGVWRLQKRRVIQGSGSARWLIGAVVKTEFVAKGGAWRHSSVEMRNI